ncbi:hypothetical protein ILUMI_02273 [Ignelater luminosus]|uniref:Uncharacterized protein n=1 Tax=Ignelater luminosus TaxID=2038154 RepID=A0A8K0DD02_IGNLU|nr:hypothetical protein ILUMI_02273 [Ignelater luminosus]
MSLESIVKIEDEDYKPSFTYVKDEQVFSPAAEAAEGSEDINVNREELLRLEESGNLTAPDFELNAEEELQTCGDKLILLQAEVRICRSTARDNEYKRLFTRLTHARGRLDIIPDVVGSKEDLMANLSLLFKELENKISTSSQTAVTTSSVSDLISLVDTPQVTAADDPVVFICPSSTCTMPVYQWTVQGHGVRIFLFSTVANVPSVVAISVRGGNYLAMNKCVTSLSALVPLATLLRR